MRVIRVIGTALLLLVWVPGAAQASSQRVDVYFLSRETAKPVVESRCVPATPSALVEELLKGPTDTANLYSPFISGTRLIRADCQGAAVTLDFDAGFLISIANAQDKYVEQVLRLTLAQLGGLDSYRVTVNGRAVESGSHIDFGELLDLRPPVPQPDPVPGPGSSPNPGPGHVLGPGPAQGAGEADRPPQRSLLLWAPGFTLPVLCLVGAALVWAVWRRRRRSRR